MPQRIFTYRNPRLYSLLVFFLALIIQSAEIDASEKLSMEQIKLYSAYANSVQPTMHLLVRAFNHTSEMQLIADELMYENLSSEEAVRKFNNHRNLAEELIDQAEQYLECCINPPTGLPHNIQNLLGEVDRHIRSLPQIAGEYILITEDYLKAAWLGDVEAQEKAEIASLDRYRHQIYGEILIIRTEQYVLEKDSPTFWLLESYIVANQILLENVGIRLHLLNYQNTSIFVATQIKISNFLDELKDAIEAGRGTKEKFFENMLSVIPEYLDKWEASEKISLIEEIIESSFFVEEKMHKALLIYMELNTNVYNLSINITSMEIENNLEIERLGEQIKQITEKEIFELSGMRVKLISERIQAANDLMDLSSK